MSKMGGSQSATRRITVDNPDPAIITITERVVERLQDSDKPESSSQAKEQSSNYVNSEEKQLSGVLYITSQQIRKELINEIEKNNAYWENRLNVLKDGHCKISAELEQEYNKAVKEVNQTLGKHFKSKSSDIETCKLSRNKVIECYSINKNRPLLCSEEVQKFYACVAGKMNLMF